jgi:hypothetical protein
MSIDQAGGPTPEEMGMPEQELPVYKSMKEDPAYGESRGESFIDFGHKVFGYSMGTEKDGKITAIGGENGEVPYLEIGNKIKLKGEYRELGGLEPNMEAEIIGFHKPFEDGETDHIVKVKQGDRVVSLKPYQMEKRYL